MALFDYLISDDLGITLDADFIQTTNHSLYFGLQHLTPLLKIAKQWTKSTNY